MSRVREIIDGFSRGREFAHPRSAEELLAMAYDDAVRNMRIAQEDAREARRMLQSTIEQRAAEIYSGNEIEISITADPSTWRLELSPQRMFTKMLSAHPRHWDPNVLDATVEQFGNFVKHAMTRKLYEMRKDDRKPKTETA